MRVFLCEFVTGGGLQGNPVPPSLPREGGLMRDALARDLCDLPGVTLATTHDARLPPPARGESRPIADGDDAWTVWEERIAEADLLWPVAPETGGALARLHALGRAAGVAVAGPDAEAIRIASSKRLTAERLIAAGIPTPPCWRPDALPANVAGSFISKPDDGAGCEGTRFWAAVPPAGAIPVDHVSQPFVAGDAASLTVLGRDGAATVLTANRQHVAVENGAFAFCGLFVGALDHADPAFVALAHAVSRAVPGLDGLFGVDIVLSPDGPVVIEINPRITTSYVGLRDALGFNPLRLVPPFADRTAPPPSRASAAVEIRL